MTDFTTPPAPETDAAGLLASSYLDGEASLAERAIVDADPGLLALVEHLREISNDISEPIEPPVGLAEAQVARALASFDSLSPTTGTASTASNVVPLSSRRSRAGMPAWLGAAAAAVVVVGGVGFAAANFSSSSDDASDSATAELSQETFSTEQAELSASADSAEAELEMGDTATADDDASSLTTAPATAPEPDEAEASEESGQDMTTQAREPIDVGESEGQTAFGIYEALEPDLLPISESICSFSPALDGLIEILGFVPILLDGAGADMIVYASPDSGTSASQEFDAVVLSPSCEPILD